MKDDEWRIEANSQETFTSLRLHPESPLLVLGTNTGKILLYNLQYKEFMNEIRNFEETPFGDKNLIVSPIRDIFIDAKEDLIYIFMHHGLYRINLNGFEISASIPITEEVIAGSISYKFGKIAYITASGLVSTWNLGIEFNTGDYQLDPPTSSCKIGFLSDDDVIVSSMDGTITKINMVEQFHQTLKDYSKIEYMMKSFSFDDNNDYYVTLTENGDVRVVHRISSNEKRIAKSLSTYFSPTNTSKKSLREVIKNSPKIQDISFFITDLKSSELGEMEKVMAKTSYINRQSKDRYEALVHDLDKTDETSLREIVKDESPEITLSQAIDTYVSYKNAKTRSVLKQVCMILGLDPKISIFAWKLNNRKSNGLISLSQRMLLLKERRTMKRVYLMSFAYIILISGLLTYSFAPNIQMWKIVNSSLATVALTAFLGNLTINKEPRIPFVPEWKTFWILGAITSVLLLILEILNYFKIL